MIQHPDNFITLSPSRKLFLVPLHDEPGGGGGGGVFRDDHG